MRCADTQDFSEPSFDLGDVDLLSSSSCCLSDVAKIGCLHKKEHWGKNMTNNEIGVS